MKVVVAVVLLCLGCANSMRQNNLYKNKRIIKVRVPPRQNPDFYNGPKGFLRPNGSPVRFKDYHSTHPEFSRPSYPPFYNNYNSFNSFNNIHVKHQFRPPSHSIPGPGSGQSLKGSSKEIYQKFPLNYGSSYPHKEPFSSFKFPSLKDEIRIAHTQTFSAPVASHQTPSTGSSQTISLSPSLSLLPTSSPSKGSASYSTVQEPTSYYVSTPHAHVQSSDDNKGPIREIPAPNLGPKPSEASQGEEYATYGKGPSIDVTNLVTDGVTQQLSFPATDYYSAFGQPQHFELINGNTLSTAPVYGSNYYRNNQIATIADGAAHDSAINDIAVVTTSAPTESYKTNKITVTPVPSPSTGYEVTEEEHAAGGAIGTSDSVNSQFYYAPDPDPSLPVHKVPPAKEVLTDESLAETYVPHVTQNFQILEGGTVSAPLTTLSTQELFQLMHGFPSQIPIVSEPIVTIVGHQQPAGVYLQPSYQYAQTGTGNGEYSHAAQPTSTDDHYQGAGSTQQNYISQQQHTTTYFQTGQGGSESSSRYEYEQDASESRKHGSAAKMDEDSANAGESAEPEKESQIIIHFSKIPEVPFYTTLPNKKAAEALATLQAAGSIGSNYVDKMEAAKEETEVNIPANAAAVHFRGNQDRGAEDVDFDFPGLELPQQKLESEQGQEDRIESSVEVQRSVPIYEASYAASSLLDDGNTGSSSTISTNSGSGFPSAGIDVKTEAFGKRIKPK